MSNATLFDLLLVICGLVALTSAGMFLLARHMSNREFLVWLLGWVKADPKTLFCGMAAVGALMQQADTLHLILYAALAILACGLAVLLAIAQKLVGRAAAR